MEQDEYGQYSEKLTREHLSRLRNKSPKWAKESNVRWEKACIEEEKKISDDIEERKTKMKFEKK